MHTPPHCFSMHDVLLTCCIKSLLPYCDFESFLLPDCLLHVSAFTVSHDRLEAVHSGFDPSSTGKKRHQS